MDGLQGDPLQDPVSELFVSSTVDDGFETLTLIDKEETSTTKSQSSTGSLKDHLWQEFKKYVFPKHEPLCVCKDSETFQAVMAVINKFEREASSQPEAQRKQLSEHLLKKLMKKLQKYKSIPAVFAENFPFYVVLVVRMHRRHTLYQCGELDKFIETVIGRVESLPVEKVAEVLNEFLKRGDFKIMDASNKMEVSAIQNLYEACERILELISEKRHKRTIGCWILWITIAVRCKWDLKMPPAESQKIAQTLWSKYILNLKGRSSITLSKETNDYIRSGLKLGVLLSLPDELQLNASGMSVLLFPKDLIRPLWHIRDFMNVVKEFLWNEEQFVLSFVRNSRKHYDHFLFPKHTLTPIKKSLYDASVKHNVAGFVEEGVEFLETVSLISMERQWNSDALKEECRKWFSLLLKAVEIKKGVESILRMLLASSKAVTFAKDCRPHIEREIITKTRQMFGKLDIAVFYPLYGEFNIWDNDFLLAYLTSLTSTKHAELDDRHWSLLFKDFVQRSPEPSTHGFIIDYLSSEAILYVRSEKPVRYILHLMKLDVPNLFTGPPEDPGVLSGTSNPGEKFKEHLHSYIASNGLSRELLRNLDTIMSYVRPKPDGFQDLILSVLQEVVVPHLQTSTVEEKQLFLKQLNTVVCNVLKNKYNHLAGSLTRKERFCWGIVATLCDQVQPKEGSCEWAESHTAIIEKIGEIYSRYCQRQHSEHGTKESIVAEQFKPDICKCPPEVQKYYLWVEHIHTCLCNWHEKIVTCNVNYDDMIDYANRLSSICKIAKAVCATKFIVDDEDIAKIQTTYLKHLEELNVLLLKYVPEVPRAKWCTLTSVLNMYGISIPDTIQVRMKQFIVLPDEDIDCKLTLQRHPMTPNKTGEFQPPQPISLRLGEQFTLREMGRFFNDFKGFLKPIQECVDTLIFFTLHDSYLFSVYLKHELETKERDLNSFRQAFDGVISVLVQLCHGEANYSQITANGAVSLENVDIQKELTILSQCEQLGRLPGVKNTQGLDHVKKLLDLLKISAHVRMLRCACQQYQLEGCLKDENLIKLTTIADTLMTEEARASLTPLSATHKMDTVSDLLDTKGGVVTHDYEYLAIFSKIGDSAKFHQFICEKGFTGEDGEARFHQQYQLVTAQLQHEEYDEAVLNVLYAAYKLILPFTVKNQSFYCLLESVKQLLTASPGDTVKRTRDCLMQIETVNRNINLIQLWFTRAEGNTLQNVAAELKRIFETGHFKFIVPENIADPGEVELWYTPASKQAAEVVGTDRNSVTSEEEVFVKEERWDSEQTGAFARKLGLIDSEKASGELVKPFLHANEVANKLLDFLLKLREMGYPSHLTVVARNGLRCNDKETDQVVKQIEHTVDEWSQSIDKLLLKHHWLLLFNLPKLHKLSKFLTSEFRTDDNAMGIMQEICFLLSSDIKSREKVLVAIKDSLSTLQKHSFDKNDASYLFRLCGFFLDVLFKHSEIAEYSPQKYKEESHLTSSVSISQPTLYFTHSMEFLHSALDFSQEELISVIVNIYKGRLPQPYEFFRCDEKTTAHQLKLFITRAANHSLTFVILGVNLLSIKLQEMLLRQHKDFPSSSDHEIQSCIHYVETVPSVLQDMARVHQVKHKLLDVASLRKEVQNICHQQAVVERGLKCVEIVYGAAGCGKTHFIKQQLQRSSSSVTVAINESFETLKAIQRLFVLPKDEKNCAIFFNFHLIPPVGDFVRKEDRKNYDALIETVSWFFFDLLFLGYVEDSHSGESFQLPGGLSWSIYVEVPSRNSSSNADDFLEEFLSEIPILKLLGTPKLVESTAQYIDVSHPDVQLVCKYLKAYETGGKKGIDKLYKDGKKSCKVKFSTEADLSSDVCQRLLVKYMPPSVRKTITSQLLFLRYMKRRCWFLDNLPAYNFNTGFGIMRESGEITDTLHLGSTLIAAMIKEAEQFSQPCLNEDGRDYHQLIYDVQDGGGSIGLLSTVPEKWTHLRDIGVDIPTMNELYEREFLDKCLSRALNIPLQDGRLIAIDEENYVLTLDFTIKMLQIHERYVCGEPIILQGETGVGKTSLLQMLSKLWNVSLDMELKRLKERVLEFLQNKLKNGSVLLAKDRYEPWLQVINSLISGVKKSVEEEDLMLIATLPFQNSVGYMYKEMKDYLEKIIGDPILSLLKISSQEQKNIQILFKEALAHPQHPLDSGFEQHAKPVVKVFYTLLTATVKTTFHKLNIHAAIKPDDLWKELKCAFEQAHQLQKANAETSATFVRVPHVTIFLDELNTSTCGGLFKEFIVDRTFQGEPIPKNLFIVAACNPHRGNSLAALTVANVSKLRYINDNSDATWLMDSYYVRQLHPTLAQLMWDYGSLDEGQEGQYVQAKVNMFMNQLSKLQTPRKDQHSEIPKPKRSQPLEAQKQEKNQSSEIYEPESETKKTKNNQFFIIHSSMLTEMIVFSQNMMRKYAFEELRNRLTEDEEAELSSRCCVSQRDIQRVFTFYEWTMKVHQKINPHNDSDDSTSSLRAILVALGLVYYMRLNRKYRSRYQNEFALKFNISMQFSEVFQSELDWYTQQIELPKGIAKTQALKENLFAVIICTVTQTPLIIVGAPGSSKTLSFNIVVSNLRGHESKNKIFRETDIFCCLDPHFYQCSHHTTSTEVHTVFLRAITRQKKIGQFSLPIKCVVFMDEAGLPERSHESLKILHQHLDNPEVSFVAISNTVLDASKTNRAITLFRDPTEISEDLEVLATECLYESPGCFPRNLKEHFHTVVNLSTAYTVTITKLKLARFFGLRDFIHFVQYVRYKCVNSKRGDLALKEVGQFVIESLERNFSGSQQFSEICEAFLDQMNLSTSEVKRRDTLKVLEDSLKDKATIQDEVRYKIIIHSSDDDSMVRLLFQYKSLGSNWKGSGKMRVYMCSHFPGDTELQKIDTIAGIRHSAIQGHSIVMLQTDDIHESFYDLFNRRFKQIDIPVPDAQPNLEPHDSTPCDSNPDDQTHNLKLKLQQDDSKPDDDTDKSSTRLYANIAIGAHLKPCRVHPNFKCIVALKKSELGQTPAPFLNRFEKYYITHEDIYECVLNRLPMGLKSVVEAAYDKVQEFIMCSGGPSSFYGFCEQTLHSLLLKVLPVEFKPTHIDASKMTFQTSSSLDKFENAQEKQIHIVQVLTEVLTVKFNFRLTQGSTEEMEYDAESLASLVQSSNPMFEGIIKKELNDVATARQAVLSAFNTLQRDPVDSSQSLAPASQLMRSLLVQWLVRYLCKEVMQLMTPEALVLHERQIPASYIHNYLTYQKHFSLIDLIKQQINRIGVQGKISNNKLLCFTRTSALINNLPSEFSSTVHSASRSANDDIWPKRHIFGDISKLIVCKIEVTQSQRSVRKKLIDFLVSEENVLFLLANVQEVSRNTVNHLRVMIEEAEASAKDPFKPKLFVVLLHFPPTIFFNSCYPSLFLNGWDLCYLDTIAHGHSHGIVDSVEWFRISCFPTKQNVSSIKDTFFVILKDLLRQSIPHVVSRLSFGSDDSRPFNQKMAPSARSEMLQQLFDTEIGDALCHHFRSYWKAEVMTEYLHRTVKFTQTGQTTLNITDSIHSLMKSHFLHFVLYMINYMNDNYNLDILFSLQSTDEVKQLFLDLTKCLPIPQKLSKLKILSSIQHGSHHRKELTGKYQLTFPYFSVVCPQIMDLVKEVAYHLCQSEDSNIRFLPEMRVGYQPGFEELNKHLEERLIKIKEQEGCVAVAVVAIDKHKQFWNRYFHDFAREQLSMWSHNQKVDEIIEAVFGAHHTFSASNISQLTSLHVYTYLNQSKILKAGAVVHPLIKLPSDTEQRFGRRCSSSTSPSFFLKTEDMTAFVMNTFFASLLTACGSDQTSGTDVELWYNAYHALVHSPAIRKDLYSVLSETSEAKLNVMHAAFLAVQYDPNDKGVLKHCRVMVDKICSKHFNRHTFKLQGSCPQMPAMFEAITEVFGHTKMADVSPIVPFIVDGLLTHFFCYYDKPNKVNVQWLLGHINEQKHWLKNFQLSVGYDKMQSTLLSYHSDPHCLPLNALKFYLLRILDSCKNESTRQLVAPYEPEGRAVLGTFLSEKITSNFTGTYIPPFYRLSKESISKNDLHSQPLAYLYFLTFFESLLNQQNDLSVLLGSATEIYETKSDKMEMKDKILLCIEKQALVQIIIRELPEQLMKRNYRLASLQKSLNALLDKRTSGGRIEVHGEILAMHMLKQTQSLEKFTRLITEQYHTHCSDYKCLRGFDGRIKEVYTSRTNFYHLLQQANQTSELGRLHQQVCKLVTEIVEQQVKPKRLIDMAKKSERVQVLLPSATGSSDWMEKLPCVRMMIWLAVYHQLYNQQRQSKEMAEACSQLPPKFFDVPFCQLLCWFACPKDPPTPRHLSELFGSSRTDPTDVCLRHCLANLVACAIGTCDSSKNSHLWYLVFAPEKLKGTYLAGSMDNAPVNSEEGKSYEERVKLEMDEDKLRSFLQHSTRRGLSLNSRCMLLWINIASFCVSLLTRDRETLSGILSNTVPMEEYCVSQLRHIWKFMRNNMQLTDEELSYLVMMCMRRNLQAWVAFTDKMSGTFTSAERVAEYEQCWHSNVFMPSLEKLGSEFIQQLQDPLKSLLVEIRQLEAHYPHFPANAGALYSVLSLPDVQTQSQNKLVVLSKFICKMPELQTTLPYLPDFVAFYQWLHKDLAGELTPEKADKVSIKRLVDQMSSHYSCEGRRKLMNLYKQVKWGYSQYIRNGPTSVGEFDEICVRSFLTLDASKLAGNSEGDILYSIIYEMVNSHNNLLECVQTVSSHSKNTHLNRYILGSIPSVIPTGVTENTSIVGRSEADKMQSKFLELVSRRHRTSMATQSHHAVTNWHLLTLEDLMKLQEDVVSLYLSGRPKIRNIASLHIPYAFRASKPASKAHPLNFAQDLNQVGKCLPRTLKSNMTEKHQVLQLLEFEFHSADYHAMLDVLTGLKSAIVLLEKRVQEVDSDEAGIHELSLKAFLCSEEDEDQIIEIFGKRLSERQISTVMNLPVSTLYHTFTTFIQWVADGRYDFYMLPYVLKAHLNPADMEQLVKIRVLYKKGSEPKELLMELKLLTEVLDHLEPSLTGLGTQVPLVDYLTSMFVFEGHDEFLGLIPQTILIQHYVSLRILLKQLAAETQKDLPKSEGEMEKPWCELVHNFAGTTAEGYKSHTDYGFKPGHETDTESDSESAKGETFSSVTHYDAPHEDELDELYSLQENKGREYYASSPVDETPLDALQQSHQSTTTETKQETDNHSASLLSHEMPMDTLQQVHLLMESETKPESDNHSAKWLVNETSIVALHEAHLLTTTEANPETNEKQLLQLARQYSSEAVGNFVTSIGLSDHAKLFEDNGLSGDALMECTDEDLEDLGIESALSRLKIMILFRRQLQGLGSLAKNFPTDKVVAFLDGLKQQEKEQYKQSFRDNQIDGEMLLAMQGKDDVMIELGVQRPIHRRIILSTFKTLIEEQGHSNT